MNCGGENAEVVLRLLDLVKESLSIVSTATLKDNEIKLWIKAALEDMSRQGITVPSVSTENSLVVGAIVMYAKANFGMCDIREKELAQKAYISLCQNISLSYKSEVE